MFGSELVSWLVEQMPSAHHESAEAKAEKRTSACGMFQALVEEGALSHGKCISVDFSSEFLSRKLKLNLIAQYRLVFKRVTFGRSSLHG